MLSVPVWRANTSKKWDMFLISLHASAFTRAHPGQRISNVHPEVLTQTQASNERDQTQSTEPHRGRIVALWSSEVSGGRNNAQILPHN